MSDDTVMPADRERITRMEVKIDSIYAALMGNHITDDGGMVARLKRVESKVQDTETELNRYKWALVGISTVVPVLVAVIIFIMKQFDIVKP
jgi:hypothetical protein